MATNWLATGSASPYPTGRKDPLVDLGSSGPSTLSDLYSDAGGYRESIYTSIPREETEFVQSSAPRATGAGADVFRQAMGMTNPFAAPEQPEPNPVTQQSTSAGADRAMLGTAIRTSPLLQQRREEQVANNAAAAAAGGSLQDIMAGIAADSNSMFQTLIEQAGARGQATSEAIGGQTARTDARIGQAAEAVGGGGGAGGLSGQRLAQGATAGSQGIRDVQSALGGFLEQSQLRRTNATQDYLAGLQGQSQIVQDRARTLGEFTLQQQRAIAEQERVRSQNDIASETASDAILQTLMPGVNPAGFRELPNFLQQEVYERTQGGTSQAREPGIIGQELAQAGISQEALEPLEQLETNADRWFQGLDPEQQRMLQDESVPPMQKANMFAEDNFIVVAEDDPRVNSFVDVSGERRLAISPDDWRKYLQWAGQ